MFQDKLFIFGGYTPWLEEEKDEMHLNDLFAFNFGEFVVSIIILEWLSVALLSTRLLNLV